MTITNPRFFLYFWNPANDDDDDNDIIAQLLQDAKKIFWKNKIQIIKTSYFQKFNA